MNQKLPYYMAYPMPLSYDDEKIERMDFEYLRSMYPEIPKRILPYIEEECDRMEHAGSMIYDEYPDKLQLRLMRGRICRNFRKNEKRFLTSEKAGDVPDICQTESRTAAGTRNGWLEDLVEVMLYQELYRRRCDRRRRSRRIY